MNEPAAAVVPRRVAVAVGVIEAAAGLVTAGLLVGAAVSGRATAVSGAYVLAAIAVLAAVTLAVLAVALARGRSWPVGLLVTVQLFIAVVALSQLGAALRAGQGLTIVLLLAGLGVAAAGLWSAARLATSNRHSPPGSAERVRDPR